MYCVYLYQKYELQKEKLRNLQFSAFCALLIDTRNSTSGHEVFAIETYQGIIVQFWKILRLLIKNLLCFVMNFE